MRLSSEQLQSLTNGQAVSITVEGQQCIVIKREIYERVRHFVTDNSEMTHDELRQMLAHCYEGSGWDEPEMNLYDDYDSALENRSSPQRPCYP